MSIRASSAWRSPRPWPWTTWSGRAPPSQRLKRVGVRLAIDDFGTGYSSLGYLKQFPVDVVKIDRSFVDGLDTNPVDSAIAAAVIGLATAVGMTTVAEGVETVAQLEHLDRSDAPSCRGSCWAGRCRPRRWRAY